MSTELDLDISALIGDMEALRCEHPTHARQAEFHSDDPASHYAQTRCGMCGYHSRVIPICPGLVSTVLSGQTARCNSCDAFAPALELITILGPVNQ